MTEMRKIRREPLIGTRPRRARARGPRLGRGGGPGIPGTLGGR